MIQFEMTGRLGRDLRQDDVRIVAAEQMRLRRNAVINVIDPSKSFQPTFPNADATCVIARRSIDARGDVVYRYVIEGYKGRERYEPYKVPDFGDVSGAEPVIVVGAGPAGLFAALKLIELGLRPIILERGKDVHGRKTDMAAISKEGLVNPESNYCFGEGGAGAFSDGKLYTRSSKRGDVREVLGQFVHFGANPQILIDARPHIGSDRLPRIVENMRNLITGCGGDYHFSTKAVDFSRSDDGTITVSAVSRESGTAENVSFSARAVILATGHSARDIYELFAAKGFSLEAKGFAMGVRVEHSQELINRSRYHGQWEPGMPAAEYSFTEQVDERGVFSFCECPGGVLVPSSTEPGTVVLNGMSNSARSGKFANAGVVVQINPEDTPEEYLADGPFGLMNFQRDLEKKMYEYASKAVKSGKTPYMSEGVNPMAAPAQRMIDFCNGVLSHDLPATSYKPGVVSAPLHELLPPYIADRLRKAFPVVGKKDIKGYFTNDALLLGIESRTSSPIRIPRDPRTFQYDSLPGIFPCGEGAGYSGGIVSSALDGINCALAAFRLLNTSSEAEPEA